MNLAGIGIPFKEQVRFEATKKHSQHKALYICHLELEKQCENEVTRFHQQLQTSLEGISRTKTQFIRRQQSIQKQKDAIKKDRKTESLDDTNLDCFPGDLVKLPPIISRSLTALDLQEHYEKVDEMLRVTEKKQTDEKTGKDEIKDGEPEVGRRKLSETSEQLLNERMYIDRSKSVYIGIPEGSLDERGLSKRLIVPGLIARWKRNATQPELKRKRRRARLLNSGGNRQQSGQDEGRQIGDKSVPFHMRFLMPINEEDGHDGKDKNPLVTQSVSSKHPERSLVDRPTAARAKNRREPQQPPIIPTKSRGESPPARGKSLGVPQGGRLAVGRAKTKAEVARTNSRSERSPRGQGDSDLKAIEAVKKETEKINMGTR